MRTNPYPTVQARLRRSGHLPGVPPSRTELLIWFDADRFLVRDENGRPYAEIVGDVTAARGFGLVPRTMEGLMDAASAARHPRRHGPTELSGDWATGQAIVREAGRPPWSIDISTVAPVAEQLLSTGREALLPAGNESTFLDRPCREYRFAIEGDEDGTPFRSEVRWLVSAPYVLLREVRDARISELSATTEVIELAEGAAAGPIPRL
ncbi:hypothetical protein ACWDV4_10160 [Micromonospora sp. NPDC003197]